MAMDIRGLQNQERDEMSEDAYVALGYAIIEQAVADVKAMQEAGIIRPDGSVVSKAEWPKTKTRKET